MTSTERSPYHDDIVHDAVGFPGSPRHGKDAAREFYGFLTANFRTEEEEPIRRWFLDDTMFLEQSMTGTVIGEMLGIPGNGRRVTFGSSTCSSSTTASSHASRSGSTPAPSSPSSAGWRSIAKCVHT